VAGNVAFISYSRVDSEFVIKLARDLKAADAGIWLDQLDIRPGERWDRAIEDALRKCSSLILTLSPASVASDNVLDEVSFALETHKSVIPVFYQDCDIPFRLHRLQYIDFRHDYAQGLTSLLYALNGASPSKSVISPFLMPVEGVTSIAGHDPVAAGRIERGKIKIGDEVEIVGLPWKRKTVVLAVEIEGKQTNEAGAGAAANLQLRNTGGEALGLRRGLVVAEPGSVACHKKFRAEVDFLKEPQGLRLYAMGNRFEFRVRCENVGGILADLPNGRKTVSSGTGSVPLTFELIRQIAMEKDWQFEIWADGHAVGAGKILETFE
jgi:translation elongation factor EF-Tu-like GTPase